jgi:hypothetical protein
MIPLNQRLLSHGRITNNTHVHMDGGLVILPAEAGKGGSRLA